MKKLYTLFIVLFGSILFGQEYRPMLKVDNIWYIGNTNTSDSGVNGTNYQFRLSSETQIFNGKEYMALEMKFQPWNDMNGNGEWSEWGISSIYLNENEEHRKVYIYYADDSWTGSVGEHLLYDFSLEVDEIIPIQGFMNNYNPTLEIKILSIDYQNIYGLNNVKTYHFENNEFQIYEGIGASSGLFTLDEFENHWTLNHFTNTLDITDHSKIETKIYPNPFSDKIQIQNSEEIKELQLFDLQGKLISTTQNLEELNSKLSLLNNAVYFLKIQFKNNKSETIKLIKNK